MILTPVILFSAVVAILSCGTEDVYSIWSDSLVGVISSAVFNSQPNYGGNSLNRNVDRLPPSGVNCPYVTDSDPNLAFCGDLQNDQVVNSPGRYLRRYLGFCQYQTLQDAPWWRTFQVIRFSNSTKCDAIKNSTDGLTATNLTAFNLVSDSINITYGLHPNGDEQNMVFSQDGNVQFLWTNFPTGFLEARQGGIDVTFSTSVERSIKISGIQVKSYSPKDTQYSSPLDFYIAIYNSGASDQGDLLSDNTIATIKSGDRTYERKEAALDFQYGQDYPLEVKFSGLTPVVTAGGKIRTQFNFKGALGLSTITEDLRYSDPACCWPTSGKLSTVFNENYILPVVRRQSFGVEEIEFTSTCGEVVLRQTGASAGDSVPARTVQLYQCF